MLEVWGSSEAGSYVRHIEFVYHSTLGLRVMKKRRRYGAVHTASEKSAPDASILVQSHFVRICVGHSIRTLECWGVAPQMLA